MPRRLQVPELPPKPSYTVNVPVRNWRVASEVADAAWNTVAAGPGMRFEDYKLVSQPGTKAKRGKRPEAAAADASASASSAPAPPAPKGRKRAPLKTFRKFSALPPEIQHEIWMHTLESRTYPTLFAEDRRGEMPPRNTPWPSVYIPNMGNARMPRINLFWICRYTRRLAIQLYGDPQKGEMLFNPAIDRIKLVDLTQWGPNYISSPFEIARVYDIDYPRVTSLEPCALPGRKKSKSLFSNAKEIAENLWYKDRKVSYYGYLPDLADCIRHVDVELSLASILGGRFITQGYYRDRLVAWTEPLSAMESMGQAIKRDLRFKNDYLQMSGGQINDWIAFVKDTVFWKKGKRNWPNLKEVTFIQDAFQPGIDIEQVGSYLE